MTTHRRVLPWLLSALALWCSVACSDDDEPSTDTGATDVTVEVLDAHGDVSVFDDTLSEAMEETAFETTSCEPGTTRCADDTTVEVCRDDGAGWEEGPSCPEGATCQGGACVCGACQVVSFDGSTCVPVGVTTCPEGWIPTEVCGCEPIIGECEADELPLHGGGCHPIGPEWWDGAAVVPPWTAGVVESCGTGPWPELGDTQGGAVQHVLAGASSEGADGSEEHPWPTIASALAAAAPGDTIALGAPDEGATYEPVTLGGAVALVGRCPSLARIACTGTTTTGIAIDAGVAGATIADLGVDGCLDGVMITGGSGHVVRGLEISQMSGLGLSVTGADDVTIQGSTITGTGTTLDEGTGIGLYLTSSADVTVEEVLVADTNGFGILVEGGSATLVRPMVTGTTTDVVDDDDLLWPGAGIKVIGGAEVMVTGGLVDGYGSFGVVAVDGSLSLTDVAVLGLGDGTCDTCWGSVGAVDAAVTLTRLLVDGAYGRGVYLMASGEVTLVDSLVRGTLPYGPGGPGGLGVSADPGGTISVTTTAIVDSAVIGFQSLDAVASMTSSAVVGVGTDPSDDFGYGVAFYGGEHVGSTVLTASDLIIRDVARYPLVVSQGAVVKLEGVSVDRGDDLHVSAPIGTSVEVALVARTSEVTISDSFLSGASLYTVCTFRSSLELSRTTISAMAQIDSGHAGFGIYVHESDFSVVDSVIDGAFGYGLFALYASGSIIGSAIYEVEPAEGVWLGSDGAGTPVTYADGVAIIGHDAVEDLKSDVTLEGNHIAACHRAGVLYHWALGHILNNTITSSTFGFAIQSDSKVEVLGNTLSGNATDQPEGQLMIDSTPKEIPDI